MINDADILEAVRELNAELYTRTNDERMQLYVGFGINPHKIATVTLLGTLIWDSSKDSRIVDGYMGTPKEWTISVMRWAIARLLEDFANHHKSWPRSQHPSKDIEAGY